MIKSNIQSLRESLGKSYVRPDIKLFSKYIEELHNNPKALDYLRDERGLTDETIAHFKLGYNKKNNSIAIPIFKNDELINFKYRLLEPKDIRYTSERGAESWIYNEEGIEEAKKKGAVLVVEGEFDLMMVWQRGISNVISPASGKDSYGVWIERLDTIPKVWIAYDNDEGGKKTSMKIAERLGLEKCFEVSYPKTFKDANEYLKEHTLEDFKSLLKSAKPYYTYRFKGLGDIINSFRSSDHLSLKLNMVPGVNIEKDWLFVVSGRTNAGKTTYSLNVADEMAKLGMPTLIMPFERGIETVGKRFLQVKFNKSSEDLKFTTDEQWESMISDCAETPIYFSVPKKDEIVETISKSKRLFDIKCVIIDHLDYVVRHTSGNKPSEIADTLQSLKRLAEELGIIVFIVTHIRKIDEAGSQKKKKASIEDLSGSSSLYQDPECVILLHNKDDEEIEVEIAKNKGVMKKKIFTFNQETGKLTDDF